ncbi:MAG TPA: flavodoxin domain-containing protein [Candidatus Limnocylindria bacterium]
MTVLVAYATRHGATRGIAERIGSTLERRGLSADVRSVHDVRDLDGYDAVVLGSAAYMYHWLPDANEFARRHRSVLASKPVWLFSSGPIGTDRLDAKGNDVRDASEPKEFGELRATLRPRGERIFFGAYDPDAAPIGLAEKLMKLVPASRQALPTGDFRDWPEIEAWAEEIAIDLAPVPVGAPA